MVGWAMPQPYPSGDFHFRISSGYLTPNHLIAAAALRFTHFLHHRFINHRHNLGIFLGSSFKSISLLGPVAQLKDVWQQRALQFQGFNLLQWSNEPLYSSCWSCLYFPSGEENENDSKETRKSYSDTSRRISFNGRNLTNVLLAINVLVYVAQLVSQGKLLLWGAKINSLIDRGQLWRLATSSFMHANILHLLVNCFSLNSVGPTVENISGPRRYLAVYFTSAIASSAMSYWFCKAPAVGASGAVFGLVGSFAIFVLRHRHMVKGAEKDLQHITHVILMNMVIGIISKGIDNWGHLGGLIGGVASSWLLGPLWRYEYVSSDGRRDFTDRAPIFSLVKRSKTSR